MQSDEFIDNMKTAAPVLLTGMGAWPAFWVYRGFDWHNFRGKESLPAYIQKVIRINLCPLLTHSVTPLLLVLLQTFFRAKIMEILILSVGILVSVSTINHRNSAQLAKKQNLEKI